MERTLVVHCPDLAYDGDLGREGRIFSHLITAVEQFCPKVDYVRLGICSLATRGPSRYFGGDAVLASRIRTAAEEVPGSGRVRVGVADGLFAACLAAQRGLVVPGGKTAEFLSQMSVAILLNADLAGLMCRLGVGTIGLFAALPEDSVSARFGKDAAVRHRIARGIEGELPGLRRGPPYRSRHGQGSEREGDGPGHNRMERDSEGDGPGHNRMERDSEGDGPGHNRMERDSEGDGPGGRERAVYRQQDFWGGTSAAQLHASRAVESVKRIAGPESVFVARPCGGRDPAERFRFVLWDRRDEEPGGNGTSPDLPWPGRVPPPAPALVSFRPLPAELVDASGGPVLVTALGQATASPARLSIGGGPWLAIADWAGPWPGDTRWWSPQRRRRAHLQVALRSGSAHLLVTERGRWRIAATYD